VIPVIDIFAGPGGLGEGFSALVDETEVPAFKIKLSLEKDENAHKTLQLRAFFRQFPKGCAPEAYYRFLRGELPVSSLYDLHPNEARAAQREAVRLTLGEDTWETTSTLIRKALNGAKEWVLIGGPPCQAYSLVGRARNKGVEGYEASEDQRHFLYREYLKILETFRPSVFVMENVKGVLSSKPEGTLIFEQIERDLKAPTAALDVSSSRPVAYRLHSLAAEQLRCKKTYILKSELYGVPQSRHRVIIIGVREDLTDLAPNHLTTSTEVPLKDVLCGLPVLRSGLSRSEDSADAWLAVLRKAPERRWYHSAKKFAPNLEEFLASAMQSLRRPRYDRGGEFIACDVSVAYRPDWYLDQRIKGVCNHTSRLHIEKDLYRYLYAACFARAEGTSPRLGDFPTDLLPAHANATTAVENGALFQDRFRVQIAHKPSTTITSHISKDGHYYIHHDPTQCRSLTVREAARLQSFPDNYFFTGPRTAQYVQVGNAVPPLMAQEIARSILDLLRAAGKVQNGSLK